MPLKIRFLVLSGALATLVLYPSRPVSASRVEGSAPSACSALPPASSPGFEAKLENYLAGLCYQTAAGWQHDKSVRSSGGVHPLVKIWYSPQMWTWITVNQ